MQAARWARRSRRVRSSGGRAGFYGTCARRNVRLEELAQLLRRLHACLDELRLVVRNGVLHVELLEVVPLEQIDRAIGGLRVEAAHAQRLARDLEARAEGLAFDHVDAQVAQ